MCRTEPASAAATSLVAGSPLPTEKIDDINCRPAATAMNEHAICEHERRAGRRRSQEHSVGYGLEFDLASRREREPIAKCFRHHDPTRSVHGSFHTKMVFRNGPPSQRRGVRPLLPWIAKLGA